jgi:hypothetical protein
MVMRKHLNVTLYVRCPSYYISSPYYSLIPVMVFVPQLGTLRFKKIIAVCCENHTKPKTQHVGKMKGLSNAKACIILQ